jgi:hypothetical protein
MPVVAVDIYEWFTTRCTTQGFIILTIIMHFRGWGGVGEAKFHSPSPIYFGNCALKMSPKNEPNKIIP